MKNAALLIVALVAAANGTVLRFGDDPFEDLHPEEYSVPLDYYSSEEMVTSMPAVTDAGVDSNIATEADETIKPLTDSHEHQVDIPHPLLEEPKQESERMIRALTLEIEAAKRETEQKINVLRFVAEANKRETEEKMKYFQMQIEAAKQEAESMANVIAQKRGVQEETPQKAYQQKRPKLTMKQIMKKTETELTMEYDSGNQSPTCPNNFVAINGGCYHFDSHDLRDWNEALKKCHALDAQSSLVSLESKEEWDHIKNYLAENKLDKRNWWIGGSDQEEEGNWKWAATDRPFVYRDWCKSEPNNYRGIENCAMIADTTERFNHDGRPCWNDFPCNGEPMLLLPLQFICEIKRN